MKKIPTLFKREFEGNKIVKVLPELSDLGLQWVLDGEGTATIKWDGACCAFIDGEFYKRYDAKNGKPVPEGAIKCQEEADPITGHLPCWVKVDPNDPADKWFIEARNSNDPSVYTLLGNHTYEAIGKHFNGNPYGLYGDILIPHGKDFISTDELNPFGRRTFEGIGRYLQNNEIEGIVFWKDGEPKCKIKRSDFGFAWPMNKKQYLRGN